VNLLLFTDSDRLESQQITVQDRRLQHLLQVHRAKVGDQVRVGEVGGLMGSGHILELNSERAVLAIALDRPPPDKLPLSLVIALPRPKMLRRILRSVAEFGAAELHLINSYRVEKSYWQTPVLQAETIREYLLQGLEQSRDTVLPQIHCHPRFKPYVEDQLPAMIEDRRALLAHPGDYPPCPRELRGETLVVIGPEGGFIPYEVKKLQDAGCETVSLGPRILRVENALTSLLGRLF
jgi:RsmE family RNA methyltransferase